MLPCLIFEDEHLLVVNKPAGLNTHAPSPYAGEGIYDWLRNRESRWADLAIIHRLDKETSGVIVFSKTKQANRSLTDQFTRRAVQKRYVLLSDGGVGNREFVVKSCLARVGEKYVSRRPHAGGEIAETLFRAPVSAELAKEFPGSENLGTSLHKAKVQLIEARPLTGRTHQIRVHAADSGMPVLGDTLYGGSPAPRVYLHAAEISFQHPASQERMVFRAPLPFEQDPRFLLRTALIDPELTDAYRVIHGASDHWPGWYVERLGEYLLSQSEQPLGEVQKNELTLRLQQFPVRGAYHKTLTKQVRRTPLPYASPQLVVGDAARDPFLILENGLKFQLSFSEGYSVGLFLDQRDNRRRLLTGHIAAGFSLYPDKSMDDPSRGSSGEPPKVLNTFAYTCGFSVCAAKGGAHATSLDLSKKYLEWGKQNFALNQIDPAAHDFIYGDTFDWLRRLGKKERLYDLILLDPPTFSQSRESGVFRVEKDYGKLVRQALPLLRSGGVLFASTNAGSWASDQFLASVEGAIKDAKRKVLQRHYVPQPPDFPISRAEPAYLKTVWLRIE